jgi:hypothetical protein
MAVGPANVSRASLAWAPYGLRELFSDAGSISPLDP